MRRTIAQLPQLNQAFRSTWELNIDKALAHIEELRAQGWTVDVEQGELPSKTADLMANVAERMGCEVERIPVAEWLGDLGQFVAYRPKQAGAEVPVLVPSEPKPEQKIVVSALTPEQVTEAFVKEFWKKQAGFQHAPDKDVLDSGYIMEPGGTVALIRRNALLEKIPQFFKDLTAGNPYMEIKNTPKTIQALKAAAKNDKYKYVTLGTPGLQTNISIERLAKGLKSLGKGTIKVYMKGENSVVCISNAQNDTVAMAPAIDVDKTIQVTNVIPP
jgi:hypothetical protein